MKKVVLLSTDAKALVQMGQWLKEMEQETLIEKMIDPGRFLAAYGRSLLSPEEQTALAEKDAAAAAEAARLAAEKPAEEEAVGGAFAGSNIAISDEQSRSMPIRVLVVDLEAITALDPKKWLADVREALTAQGFSDPEFPTRILLIAFDSPQYPIDAFKDAAIEDLVMKPLDMSYFQQKMELLLSDKPDATPSFLYRQKTELVIEMGKDSEVEEVSEIGLAIVNPVPLTEGVYARIYCSLLGPGEQAGTVGRVYKSVKHPTRPNLYLCYFAFFGLTQGRLRRLRQHLRASTPSAGAPTREPAKSGGFFKSAGITEARPGKAAKAAAAAPAPVEHSGTRKNIVVIEMNPHSSGMIRETLQANFTNADVHVFPSYSAFLRLCQRQIKPASGPAAPESGVPAATGTEALFSESSDPVKAFSWGAKASFVVTGADLEINRIEPPPGAKDKIFGEDASEFQANPARWYGCLSGDDKADFDEFVEYVKAGQEGTITTRMSNPAGQVFFLRVHGVLERAGDADGVQMLRLDFEEITSQEFEGSRGLTADGGPFQGIHGIYIDGSMIRSDPRSWLEGFMELLRKARFLGATESVPITILADEGSSIRPEAFRIQGIRDFLCKDLDRRLILEKAGLHIDGLVRGPESVPLEYQKLKTSVKVAKEVLMEVISEFGLQIRHSAPLREDVYMRFFSPMFLDEKAEGILARCAFCQKDENNPQVYHCFFSFFGVSDTLLKQIRTWIRGDYIAKRGGDNSG